MLALPHSKLTNAIDLRQGERLVGGDGDAASQTRAPLAAPEPEGVDRSRLSLELQDSIQQQLFGLALMAKGWQAAAAAGRPIDVVGSYQRVASVCQQALGDLLLLMAQERLSTVEPRRSERSQSAQPSSGRA